MVLPWVKRIRSNTLVGNSSAEVFFLALSESGWRESLSSMHDVLNVVKNSDAFGQQMEHTRAVNYFRWPKGVTPFVHQRSSFASIMAKLMNLELR
jgi:hypothetical protein